jgi:FKBP-type peptidyl-prolyl cis-trans isomerase
MSIVNPDGSMVKNSFGGKPILFPIKVSGFEGDIYEAIAMLSIGDSAQFLLPADSTFSLTFHQPIPQNIKPGDQLILTAKILDIKTERDHMLSLLEDRKSKLTELKDEIASQEKTDRIEILKHIESNELSLNETESGMFYEILSSGEGEQAAEGKTATFHIECQILKTGAVVESTLSADPVFVTINSSRTETISGINEALKMLKPGGKGTFYIPSHLGYSYVPKDKIPPFSVLKIYIELIAVR